jgi:hypothetical protein
MIWLCRLFLLIFVGLALSGCSQDNQTGLWVRITSATATVDKVFLEIFDSTNSSEMSGSIEVTFDEPQALDPIAKDPANQLWVLILAGQRIDRSIRIYGIGSRNNREVAYGFIDHADFVSGQIVDLNTPLELSSLGEEDVDQDGFFVPDDCDDNDENVNPEAEEICDGRDNNCDGAPDEGCACTYGDRRSCWPYWASEISCQDHESEVCQCSVGTQVCLEGKWGICHGLQLPHQEGGQQQCGDGSFNCYSTCQDNIDNDCNGYIDESDLGCGGCLDGSSRDCYDGPADTLNVGLCHSGQQWCSGGTFEENCHNQTLPTTEICDRSDHDCDGDLYNSNTLCPKQQGVCQGTIFTCMTGILQGCSAGDYQQNADSEFGSVYVTQETTECDSFDNDCDGMTDEECVCSPNGAQESYGSDVGECQRGTMLCVDGEWEIIKEALEPTSEACDGLDSNCNDVSDDQDSGAFEWCLSKPRSHASLEACLYNGSEDRWFCKYECNTNYWDFDNDRYFENGNGCETYCVQTSLDIDRCDLLDNDCDGYSDSQDPESQIEDLCPSRPNTSVSNCQGGVCDYACHNSHRDCDYDLDQPVPLPGQQDSSNGCETDIRTNLLHCGECFEVCYIAHAFYYCVNRECTRGTCFAGWRDCEGDLDCETQLGTDTDCSDCNDACPDGHYCSGQDSGCVECQIAVKCGPECTNCQELANNRICVFLNDEYQCGCQTKDDCASGYFCENNTCLACEQAAHCGVDCVNCLDMYSNHVCVDTDSGFRCGCLTKDDCQTGEYCEVDSCTLCSNNSNCGDSCVDCAAQDYDQFCYQDNNSYSCGCESDDHCGGDRATCNTTTHLCE